MSEDSTRPYDEWIAQARAGSSVALDRVIETLSDHLWLEMAARKERRGLGPSNGFSDLVQDTLLRVRERFSQFERHSFQEFRQWARAIFFRRWQELARNHHARTRDEQRVRIWMALASKNISLDVSHQIEIQEESEKAFAAYEQLEPHEQSVIYLRLFSGLRYRQIAEATGKTEASVRMAYERAIERLRQHFERHD